MKRRKRKTIWAYLDGKKLVDVVQAALTRTRAAEAMKDFLEAKGYDAGMYYQAD